MNELITTQLISTFGISENLFWWVVICATSLFLTIAVGMYTRSSLLSLLVMPIPFVFGIVWGYIPFWVGIMLPMPFLYTMMNYSYQGENTDVKPYWEQYGENLKNAYNSKFGGENPAFNQEVDEHVAIMINNGRGFTRSLANDWMKRMAKFTESK